MENNPAIGWKVPGYPHDLGKRHIFLWTHSNSPASNMDSPGWTHLEQPKSAIFTSHDTHTRAGARGETFIKTMGFKNPYKLWEVGSN